jgi:hypothetical protein
VKQVKSQETRRKEKQYRVSISHLLIELENLHDDVNINRAWENIRENI